MQSLNMRFTFVKSSGCPLSIPRTPSTEAKLFTTFTYFVALTQIPYRGRVEARKLSTFLRAVYAQITLYCYSICALPKLIAVCCSSTEQLGNQLIPITSIIGIFQCCPLARNCVLDMPVDFLILNQEYTDSQRQTKPLGLWELYSVRTFDLAPQLLFFWL